VVSQVLIGPMIRPQVVVLKSKRLVALMNTIDWNVLGGHIVAKARKIIFA